jgi:AcrR family transcriptional regulator
MGIEERKERDKEFRRHQIMDAAKNTFAQKGFSGATIENIAEAADFSPATIYLYFKNKDELYASLSLKMLKVLVEKIEFIGNQESLSPKDKINALPEALYQVYATDPLNVTHLLRYQSTEALLNLSPELTAQIKNAAQKYINAMVKIFEEGVREGVFQDCHPVAFADIVWSIFAGLVLWEGTKKGFDPRKDFLKPTLQLAYDIVGQGIIKN